jgi:hypothetical protein
MILRTVRQAKDNAPALSGLSIAIMVGGLYPTDLRIQSQISHQDQSRAMHALKAGAVA